MKRAVWILIALILIAFFSTLAPAAATKVDARTLINPFTVKLYTQSRTNSDPAPLNLPQSWVFPGEMRRLAAGYTSGTRSLTVGNSIIFIRQAPPRSVWRPSL